MTDHPSPSPPSTDPQVDETAGVQPAEAATAAGTTDRTADAGSTSDAGSEQRALTVRTSVPQLNVDWASLRQRFRLPRPRLRLVPAIIFVAVLMLGVRVGDLWDRLILVLDPPVGPPSIAFTPSHDADRADAAAGLVPTAAAQDEAAAPAPAEEPAEAHAGTPAADVPGDAEPDPRSTLTDTDPRDMSAVELDMLRGLARRRADLEAREGELDQREALLEVAERRMDETMAELEALRAEIEGMLGQADARREEQLVSLVRMYEAMRPADAAAIFDGLELEVLLNVLERMREAKAAPIVAGMTPERAREVTSELALRQSPEMPTAE